jgi:hypothetical protein
MPLSGLFYFYGCGKKREEIESKAGKDRRSAVLKFMQLFGQEEMEKYGVKF